MKRAAEIIGSAEQHHIMHLVCAVFSWTKLQRAETSSVLAYAADGWLLHLPRSLEAAYVL